MAFSRKRGRPRKPAPTRSDPGTPELVHKRAHCLTQEALDLCLERNLITPDQHWCGIHLRWLYTVRYGAPGLRAVDPLHFGGRDLVQDSPEWRAEREREFNEAILILGKYAWMALALWVYNQRPACLSRTPSLSMRRAPALLAQQQKELDRLLLCLDRLVAHWCRKKQKKKTSKESA